MKKAARARALKEHFARQGGLCVWCGVKMKLFCGVANRNLAESPATYEHFYNRLSPLRAKYGNLGYAACHKCNSARGSFDGILAEKGFDISDIWERPDVSRLVSP